MTYWTISFDPERSLRGITARVLGKVARGGSLKRTHQAPYKTTDRKAALYAKGVDGLLVTEVVDPVPTGEELAAATPSLPPVSSPVEQAGGPALLTVMEEAWIALLGKTKKPSIAKLRGFAVGYGIKLSAKTRKRDDIHSVIAEAVEAQS